MEKNGKETLVAALYNGRVIILSLSGVKTEDLEEEIDKALEYPGASNFVWSVLQPEEYDGALVHYIRASG